MKVRITATLVFALAMPGTSNAQAVQAPKAVAEQGRAHIGEIDFFGYAGLDLDKVRAGLPIHQGQDFELDELEKVRSGTRMAAAQITGHPVTDIAMVCCDNEGHWMVYIGLAGASTKPVSFDPSPTGSALLPDNGLKLYDSAMEALQKAVRSGAGGEDQAKGYSLSKDPDLRALQLAMRDYALQHEAEVVNVLGTSANTAHRRAAAAILGYANQSRKQMDALVHASRDPDAPVRNNAVRALLVLAASSEKTAALISPLPFIDMLNSGSWTDRNKGGGLLLQLTKSRDPKLLAQLRSQALEGLLEMAQWQETGHAFSYRLILGRIAGLEEDKIMKLAYQQDHGKALVAAVRAALQ